MNDYYVYVYIDPRNYEEFYYGKGVGSRKLAHLDDRTDSAKAKRIAEIRKEGLLPIIRVIAQGLTEAEAFLIEKTLLWKLGRWTDNIATGHFADKFRPRDTLHRELPQFDFRNGFFYYNVGECPHRNWDDYFNYGFISAGGGARWRDAILGFNEGDVFAAYLKKHGFVGVGCILSRAKPVKDVMVNGSPLLDLDLRCRNMAEYCNDPELSEYVCIVEWLAKVPRQEAKWLPKSKLYTTTHVRAALDAQPHTIKFIEQAFNVNVRERIV